MTHQDALKYHISVFIATYGEKAVLAALSETLKITQDELEDSLNKLKNPEHPKRGKIVRKQNVIQSLLKQHPDKADALHALSLRFHQKTFLPALRDVRRFFEQHYYPIKKINSRTDVFPKLAHMLADLDLGELKELCELPASTEYSSLGIISDQILRRDQK